AGSDLPPLDLVQLGVAGVGARTPEGRSLEGRRPEGRSIEGRSIEGGSSDGILSDGRPGGQCAGGEADSGDLRYEVMFLLEADDASVPAVRDVWAGVGDSIVVVGGNGLWNCHIHTDDIGAVLEGALDAGRPRQVRVTDLHEQVQEERWVREAASSVSAEPAEGATRTTAVVAVANGAGIRRIFRSLGVTEVVAGGQSMNPSVGQLLDAIASAPAEQVVLLPNNENILPVAEQASRISSKRVGVVPTREIPEGIGAACEYDPEAALEGNLEAMGSAARRVLSGSVTRAVRSSDGPSGPIAAGDWLGVTGGRIEVVGSNLSGVTCELLGKLIHDDHELVTLIEGDGAGAADTRSVTEWLGERRPGLGVEVHHGGQPLYPYLLSIE
ncbi:MAG: DAK2 domain-containing protein, partial [Acidimicrobiales bacterium]